MPIGSVRSGILRSGAAIPDSEVSQYLVDKGTGSSTLSNEFAGQPDATISGASWVSDASLVGGWGLDFDGVGDVVTIASDFGFVGNGKRFSFAVTVNMDDLAMNQTIWKQWPSASSAGFVVGTSTSNTGRLAARHYDGSSNAALVSTTSATTNRLRLGVAFDAVNNTVSIYINGSDVGDGSEYPNLTGTGNHTIGEDGVGGQSAGMILDNPIWYDSKLSPSEFAGDYNAQPWS